MTRTNFPRLAWVKQNIPAPVLSDVSQEIERQLEAVLAGARIAPGAKIAITAGSRGIKDIALILKTIVAELKSRQAEPFIIPAMGSHGGAVAEGQTAVLERLGVTEATVGAPIRSSIEVVRIGSTDSGIPVFVDKLAAAADGLIVVNRVKPHTEFEGRVESGLMKMMVIGIGNHRGAITAHQHALKFGYERVITEISRTVMAKMPVICGVAVLENAYDQTADLRVINTAAIETVEKELLEKAKNLMARLPVKELDVLLVDQLGKEISGVGMDPNVTGRIFSPTEQDPPYPRITRIVAFDLTEATHGSAVGVGLADFTTRRLVEKINYEATYVNSITANVLEKAKIPIICETDREAVAYALNTCGPVDARQSRLIRIKNTLELSRFLVSEALLPLIRETPGYEITDEPAEMEFDGKGNFARFPLPIH